MTATPIIDPRDDAWYAERRTYIGASDVPIIIGISPYKTPYDLWLEKTGQREPEPPSEVQSWGHRVEQLAADFYAEQTGRRLRRYTRVQRHRQWPFIAANPDRGVIGEKRGVQVKSSWKPWPDGVPEAYQVQCQVEMGVMGWEADDIALLTGYGGFRIFELERDDLRIRRLFTIVRAWWQRHIVEGIPPDRTGRHLDRVFGEDSMRASAVQADVARELRSVREAIARLEGRDNNLTEWLKRSMAGALRLDGRDYGFSISWKPSKARETTDWRAVATAFRRLLDAQVGDVEPPLTAAEMELARSLRPEQLDALVGIHTSTAEGSRPFRLTWHDQTEED